MFRQIIILLGFILPLNAGGQSNGFLLSFENDMWNRMDWYFSNGINIGLYHKALSRSPVNYIMLPGVRGSDRVYTGLRLRQEIYTPRDLNMDEIQEGDHPYAATLSIASERSILRPGVRFHSSLQLGILGPSALGFQAQEFIHKITPSDPPQGWNNQVGNDLMLNYNLGMDREILRDGYSQFILEGRARLGTVYTDAYAGFRVRFEADPKYFSFLEPDPSRRFNLYVEMGGGVRFVGYDASLQGGVFNRTSPYTIPASEVDRSVGSVNLSIAFEFPKHQLLIKQQVVGPRFRQSSWHAWLDISYRYWW